jgi:hypothetical protein
MKLFQCHAVMPRTGDTRSHLIRTYVVIASTSEEARARIEGQEPQADFVTIPVEASHPLVVDVRLMSEREVADLHSACAWNETRFQRNIR